MSQPKPHDRIDSARTLGASPLADGETLLPFAAAAPGHDPTRAVALIEKLGRALHTYGSPAHRLEDALTRVSRRLGLEAQFFSTPTALFASLGHGAERRTALLRVEPGEASLEKLSRLDAVLAKVIRGQLSPGEAERLVDDIVDAEPRYGATLTTLSYALASGAAARFFGGGWAEIAGASLIGLLVGLLALGVVRQPAFGRLLEPVSALMASFCAALFLLLPGMGSASPHLMTLAGLIVLLPGLSLTVGLSELATRNLVSGGARLAGVALVFLTLGFGVALGGTLGAELVGAPAAAQPLPLAPWTELPALAVACFAFTVLFRAHPREIGWIFAAGAISILGGRLGSELLGPELGAMVAAVLLGLGSNLYARLLDRPAVNTQLPGLMLLVPGSLGFRGMSALIERDTLTGVQTAFSVTLVAIALVTGLLIANVLLPPKRSL